MKALFERRQQRPTVGQASSLPIGGASSPVPCRPRYSRSAGLSTFLSPLIVLFLALLVLSSHQSPAAQPKFTDFSATTPKASTPSNAAPGITNAAAVAATNPAPSAASTPLTNAPGTSNLAASTNSMDTLDDKYKLAIGDRISFRIVEDEEDPKQLFVTDSGELELPYLGRVPATGKTCKQLALGLKKDLEKDYYYHATVIVAVDVMTKSRGKVYINGMVRAPGPQDLPSDENLTVSRAILRAGGFTDFADKRNVKVTRKSSKGAEQDFLINVQEILEKGKSQSDLLLEPNDLIRVSERLVRF